MGAPVSTPAALASAKQALKNAELFGHRDTGNKKAGDDRPSYSAARAARKESAAPSADNREFMGIRANQSNELNTALASRDEARKALQ